MKEATSARLLIVDDEAALMTALCKTLELEGYLTTGFTSARRALEHLREHQFDILLTDLMMPEMDGITLLRSAQQIDRDLAGIVMTGHGTIDTAVKALQSGALDYVVKPFRLDNLLPTLSRALATRRLQAENIRLREAVSIFELSRAITRGLEKDEVIQRTLDAAGRQHDAAAVCILLPTAAGNELRVAGIRGPDAPWARDERVELNASIVQWVSVAREQLTVWDGSGPLPAVFEQPFGKLCQGVALPIVAGGDLYGVLTFCPPVGQRRPSLGQVKALDILANTAASALEAASLLAQLRDMNQELEQRVRDRTRDLEASNADLESFSYSVSHDLRAPLRAIDGFCNVFLSDYGGEMPEDARDLLARVLAGVARMQRLIDDLLHLARFGRQPLETHVVSMTELVKRVTANLRQQWQERKVDVQIADLPDCRGDASLLEQVVTNLVSNAFKFTATRDPGRIEVGSSAGKGEQVYFVRDNGVGFDMKYADKLFGVFQRLHTEKEFPGTGIGLSIVHRIIRRHGGRTWAESRPNEGTTLYFSLPASTPK